MDYMAPTTGELAYGDAQEARRENAELRRRVAELEKRIAALELNFGMLHRRMIGRRLSDFDALAYRVLGERP